jgi:hypothetical protein
VLPGPTAIDEEQGGYNQYSLLDLLRAELQRGSIRLAWIRLHEFSD